MSTMRTHRRSLLQAVICAATVASLAAGLASSASAGSPPDGRAYELVSPVDKLGSDVMGDSSRVRAARSETRALPMAVTFASLGAFADAVGTGLATEYLSERDGTPGTSGWTTHAITPPQQPESFLSDANALLPMYTGDTADDLSRAVFTAWSPLGPEPNIQDVMNLYTRTDLRTPGAGTYQLLTNSASLQPPMTTQGRKPVYDGASSDFRHVVFESRLDLTPDATGSNVKLYKADDGVARVIAAGPGCPGVGSSPCSLGGNGFSTNHLTERVISLDGRRVNFTQTGVVSRLFQLDDGGTTTPADDVTIQLNTSEKSSPGPASGATYQTASTDGSRVFFTSEEQLTDSPGGGLYMWARQPTDEVQSIAVDATGGTFTVTAHTQPSVGSGTLANGSTSVTGVVGSFSVGQTVTAADIPPGTTITAVDDASDLTLSAPATADGVEPLTASVQQTTAALPWNATSAQVQAALEGLSIIGAGNVTVTGGPGGAGGAPYVVTFTGGLAGVDVAPLTTDATGLSGGASSADVTMTRPVRNLTLLADDNNSGTSVLGASHDGHRIYFTARIPLMNGVLPTTGIYLWQDVNGGPGELSFVGGIPGSNFDNNVLDNQWPGLGKSSRVTPDGRYLLFEASDGSELRPGYAHGVCVTNVLGGTPDGQCAEVYVYDADTSTPLDPNVICASCDLAKPMDPNDTMVNVQAGVGGSGTTWHLNHPITDDGRFVFFSTAEALVPEDVNGKVDAYEYDTQTQHVHLLSTGTDSFDSYFMDSSANGNDAFILTRQQLVGWDRDQAYDVYDVRVGGGFPDPPPPAPACSGDGCQGQVLPPPAAAAVGSATFQGPGNATPVVRPKAKPKPRPKKCPRGQVRRRVHGKVRCVKPAHRAKPRARHAAKRGNR